MYFQRKVNIFSLKLCLEEKLIYFAWEECEYDPIL